MLAPEPVVSHRLGLPHRAAGTALTVAAVAVLAFTPGGPGVREVRAAASVNLDQWANLDRAWQNGNLNGNNTRMPEGGIVPFRLAVEGLSAGAHTIRIQYDFTAGGHKAYDFLATYNGWTSPPICDPSGGGISSMCPSMPTSSSAAFPSDGFVTDGLSVRGAEAYSGVPRRLTIWGGTIASISGPSHAGPTSGNSTAEFTVRFVSTGAAVLLAWGGHLGQSAYWDLAAGGTRDGAGEVSGAPWHMRTLQLDGSGNRNQDRSIQPSAIVGELPPRALAPATPRPVTPTARPGNPTARPGNPAPTFPNTAGIPPDLPVPTPPATSVETPAAIAEPAVLPARGVLVILLVAVALGLGTMVVTRALQRRRG